jgi:5-(carboxyamino)imidazole ribonucleotide synthase
MVNLIGRLPPASALLALPGVHWHDYGKSPRPGRKLGHLTQVCPTRRERDRAAARIRRIGSRSTAAAIPLC